ncbi:glycosyltransferase family 4 protein [Bacteroides fragilis]|uniref:glycosyltransferase family 4 protein n=1 Tax=Bacteroides fragilis TaxID=817 RepID=UPI001C707424|nr:glycosyltransferase family 4 protein [Bacteroides fragilis]MBW9276412.1 glycosyltransferase family 4 protein [Bacteroides fragilis]
MKIVYYLPSLYAPGGLERIITFKANYFAEHLEGYEIYILTSEQVGQKPYYTLSPKVKHIDLDVPFDWPFNQSRISKLLKYPYRYWLFKRRFSRTLTQIHADITISTLRRELNFISSVQDGSAKIGEFHVTRHSYGVGSREYGKSIVGKLRNYWTKAFMKNLQSLAKVVLLTNEEAENWPELSNLCIIPNPVIITPDRQSDCTTKQVIAAGRYASQKGFDLLIQSWALVSKQHPDWTLRIYGEGTLRGELQKEIERLKIDKTCILEPTVSDIVNKYYESSIFVLSSRFEGFGMVITEAMSCGVPPVAFACPCGPKDIIENGKNGILVQPENIDEMALQITKLIENEKARKEMGQQANIRSHRFQMETIVEEWKELFKTLTNKQ